MLFENHTPFPAIAWETLDNQGKVYASITAKVTYRFGMMDDEGLWSLMLDPEQGELRVEDVFYDSERESALRYENDYAAFKPHGELILNANTYASQVESTWECGVKAVRYSTNEQSHQTEVTALMEQWLRVYGERYWEKGTAGWQVGKAANMTQLPLRYEYAYGGVVINPDAKSEEEQYIEYYESNPVGRGLIHDLLVVQGRIPMPRIESSVTPITDAHTAYKPEGLGAIDRTWLPRRSYVGTFDERWKQEKHPLMPEDYQEQYNNAAHPSLQLKEGYFKPDDTIILYRLLPGRQTQALQIPSLYLKGAYHIGNEELPYYLEIDTVLIDIDASDPKKHRVIIHYRNRLPYRDTVGKISLGMIVHESMIANPPKETADA